MKATNIGKTIIVWSALSDEEASAVVNVLTEILKNYRELTQDKILERPIAIELIEPNNYLCVLRKNNEVMVCATRSFDAQKSNLFTYNAVISADNLYRSLLLLKKSYRKMSNHISILQRFPETEWIKLPFNKAFEEYCLSPNINPQNFIAHLEAGTLSEYSKQFLRDAGFALENSEFSLELQQSIHEANELLAER